MKIKIRILTVVCLFLISGCEKNGIFNFKRAPDSLNFAEEDPLIVPPKFNETP